MYYNDSLLSNSYTVNLSQKPLYLSYPQTAANYYYSTDKCLYPQYTGNKSCNSSYNYYDLSRDSGNATFMDESTSVNRQEEIHTHRFKADQDNCQLCIRTRAYLLETPSIYLYDFKHQPKNIKSREHSWQNNYKEYQLLNDFQFAKAKRMTEKDILLPNNQSINPTAVEDDFYKTQLDFEMNGKTMNMQQDELLAVNAKKLSSSSSARRHRDYQSEFLNHLPCASSTPAKNTSMTYRQPKTSSVTKTRRTSPTQAKAKTEKGNFSWKKPTVLDPHLSPNYNKMFPSL